MLLNESEVGGGGVYAGNPLVFAEIIGRMCAPQRSDRYATLAEALEDLSICEA
jgi:hypothetical protein